MAKLTVVILMVTLVVAVKGFPAFDSNLSNAAAAGNWDEVHRLLGNFYRQINNWQPQPGGTPAQLQAASPAQLQQLQQQTNAAVLEVQRRVQQQLAQQAAQLAQQTAQSAQQPALLTNTFNSVGGGQPGSGGRLYEESESTYSSNNNGVVHSGGHKLINDNGVITQYDFTPQPVLG